MPRKTRKERRRDAQRQFIVAYLSLNLSADACNADFNDRFAHAFPRAGRPLRQRSKLWGSMPCPAALALLREMYRQGALLRRRVSLIEHGHGFPNWVNSYSLPAEDRMTRKRAERILKSLPQPPR